jgi:uroporphyrinogen decarboxylase
VDSRERTFLALQFQEPDRLPVDVWMSAGFSAKLTASCGVSVESFLDAHDVDLRYIEGPAYIGPPLRRFADGTENDLWGVARRAVTATTAEGTERYWEVERAPLAAAATEADIHAYRGWPSADWYDYSGIEAQCESVRRRGRVAVFVGDRLNRVAQLKPAMYLRGVEQVLEDMSLRPAVADALFCRIRSFYFEYLTRILESARGKLDIVLTGDDFGTQHGPIVSPAMWERYLGEGFASSMALVKSAGARSMHHTCGSVLPIVPLMLDRGLQILQSLQPEARDMDHRALKRAYAARLAFHGGISIQRTMPSGSPEDIAREVRERMDSLGRGGGYIICTSHNVQADVPVRNLIALLDACAKHGRYR